MLTFPDPVEPQGQHGTGFVKKAIKLMIQDLKEPVAQKKITFNSRNFCFTSYKADLSPKGSNFC